VLSKQEIYVKQNRKRFLWLTMIFALALMITACKAKPSSDESLPVETATAEDSVFSAVYPPEVEQETITLDGATVTDSGLQFLELRAGEGDPPQMGDIIVMHFIGTLPDSTEFANTYIEAQPVTVIFGHDQLLPGWEEGVGMMKVGSKARLVIPPELAFGETGYGIIPPNSQLILDVELLSIEPSPEPTSYSEADLVTTDSGLQYYDILTVDDGLEAADGYTVTTHFSIWVKDTSGNIFITSSANQEPITFVVGRGDRVFPGWDEGVLGMKTGSKRLLIIPPELALGEQSSGSIPPNATLILEVEVVDVREPRKRTEINEEDYTVTESGLKYYDIVEGDGAMPETGQTVVVHYTGWLEDGTEFDSSLNRGQPFTFPLGMGSVIPGWDEGLATMKVGGKRQLVIPAELGYGENGSGLIPPGATLIFEVELLDIQP
jgi:peptidylprolyl isomerase